MPKGQTSPVLRYLRQVAGAPSTSGTTDAQLLERFVSRHDQGAFAALVQRHGPMVFGLCRRLLHNIHDAEDAFQAAFLILARKAASIRKRCAVGPWLYGVAYRTALKARARSAQRRERETPLVDLPALEPLSDWAWRELKLVLDEEIQRLPARYRVSVVLCYLEGLTYTEAARQLGCPPGTVSGRLARARELLRSRLRLRGFTLSAGLLGGLLTAEAAPASVPLALVHSTVAASATAATGPAAAGALSAQVVALVEGVHKAMQLTRLKIMTTVLLVAGLVGASGVAYQLHAQTSQGPGIKADDKQSLEKQIEELRREVEQLKRQRWPLTIPSPQLPAEPAEVEKLKRLHQQIQGLEKIQEGLKLLKSGTTDNRANKAAVQEFEKAFKKLQQQLAITPKDRLGKDVRKRIDKLIEQEFDKRSLRRQRELMEELRRSLERPGTPEGSPDAPPPENVQGIVKQVSPEGLVRISIGSDAGLKQGDQLKVFRLDPIPENSKYLGIVKILSIRPQESVGQPVRPLAAPIRPGDRAARRIDSGKD
jgi:RNA polymerase sigma factor (sigma-70 family)